MIHYESFVLDNGLRLLVHEDHSVPIVAVNILYNVGSRDEEESRTGFAHLFEHLMFGGSKNIPSYDTPLQRVGGDNNAFTSPDITNYYVVLPADNVETAFWLESDRMLSLSFDPESLEVQRNVVIEEFKQRYLNQPYGDVWLKLRPLAYQSHPYKWATIGKDISHIENATLDDVRAFFFRHYRPNNANIVVAGNITSKRALELTKKWFGSIEPGVVPTRNLPKEAKQTGARLLEMEASVPASALYKVYHMAERLHPDFQATDLLSDLLGRGKSSRLYESLVIKNPLFSQLSGYITASFDPGLVCISGRLNPGVSFEQAENGLKEVLEDIKAKPVPSDELEKVKNQAETTHVFSELELLNRATNLAVATVLGNPELVNTGLDEIREVTTQQVHRLANELFTEQNCSTIYYKAKGQ
jgi:zinc protease